jgi:hypothetical protein
MNVAAMTAAEMFHIVNIRYCLTLASASAIQTVRAAGHTSAPDRHSDRGIRNVDRNRVNPTRAYRLRDARRRMTTAMKASCACGGVELETSGTPLTSAVCYCDDCQEGARLIEALPGAGPVQDRDGGTAYVMYRKDRVRWTKGSALLKSYKIKEASATKRIVAACCNSAMLLKFDDGKHWVDVYRARLSGDVPPVEMRVFTKFKPDKGGLAGDVPSYATFSLKLVIKLLAARIAMMLGR